MGPIVAKKGEKYENQFDQRFNVDIRFNSDYVGNDLCSIFGIHPTWSVEHNLDTHPCFDWCFFVTESLRHFLRIHVWGRFVDQSHHFAADTD